MPIFMHDREGKYIVKTLGEVCLLSASARPITVTSCPLTVSISCCPCRLDLKLCRHQGSCLIINSGDGLTAGEM